MTKISVDNPSHVDALGRIKFARHLLDLAIRVDADSAGTVIGLEAEWGAGKTHLLASLDTLIAELPDETRPILIRFNPWMISGSNGLVEALLLQMSAELAATPPNGFRRFLLSVSKRSSKEAATRHLVSSLIRYASILGAMKNFAPAADILYPGAGHLLRGVAHTSESAAKALEKMVEKRPEELSLTKARREIEDILRELERRIILVVDDLDRLPPSELAAMVQAIKAVADFPNVVYILAFDPAQAARALEVALNVNDGREYLEKIIQVPLPLPEIPASKLNRFALPRLMSVIEFANYPPDRIPDLAEAMAIVTTVLATPRDVERLRTRLQVAVPILGDKISIADLTILEVLSIKAPLFIGWMNCHVADIIESGLAGYDSELMNAGLLGDLATSSIDEKEREERAFGWQSLLSEDPTVTVPLRKAMGFLFDACRPKWSPPAKRANFRRVMQYRYWYRWRCYHDHHETWALNEIEGFVREPKRILDAGWQHNEGIFRDLCQQICDIGQEGLTSADSIQAVDVFSRAEQSLGKDALTAFDVGFGPIDALTVMLRVDTAEHRFLALKRIVSHLSVWVSGFILVRASRDYYPRPSDPTIPSEKRFGRTKDEFCALVETWFAVADAQLDAWDNDTLDTKWTPYTLCNWMYLLKREISHIQKIAAKFIRNDASRLDVFFLNFSDQLDDQLPISVTWQLLPDADRLVVLAEQSPRFAEKYTRLIDQILRPLGLKVARSKLIDVLRNVARDKGSK